MTLELRLTTKPKHPAPYCSSYLYAATANSDNEYFAIEPRCESCHPSTQTSYLTPDQARQLRNEITAFLGEQAITQPAAHDYRERDRDLASLAIHRENETLRQRLASLEKDNAALMRDTEAWDSIATRYRNEGIAHRKEIADLRRQTSALALTVDMIQNRRS